MRARCLRLQNSGPQSRVPREHSRAAPLPGRADGTDEVEEAEEIMDLPAGLIGSDPSSNEGADGGHEVTMEGRIN